MADQTIAFRFSNSTPGALADTVAKGANLIEGAEILIYHPSVMDCHCYAFGGRMPTPDTEQRLGLTLVLRKTLRRKLQLVST